MYIYFVLLVLWYFIFHKNQKSFLSFDYSLRYRQAVKLAIPLCLIMGLRHFSVGSDTEQYLYRFEHSYEMMTDPNFQFEVGYNWINYIIHDIFGLNFQCFLIITSLFYSLVLARFISKYSSNILLSFVLHLTIGIFTMSMSGVRQSLAIAFCYVALLLVKSDYRSIYYRYVGAICCSLFAWSFHNSSIIFIPFLFLTNIRISKITALLLIVLAQSSQFLKGIIINFAQGYLPSKYENMSFSTNYAANILIYIIPLLIALFCWYNSKTQADKKYDKDISLMFIFISCAIFFINMMQLNGQLGRMAYYFMYSYYILIPYTFKCMGRNKQVVLQPIVVCVCIAFFVIGSIGDIMHIDEYHFFWENFIWTIRE